MPKTPRLARPCSRPDLQPRTDGTLYCPACDDVVHDLTRATRSEASRLYRANGGKLCGLVHTYPDGELRFAPEPPRRGLLAAAGGAAIALALAGCEAEGDAAAPASAAQVEPEVEEPPPAAPVAAPIAAPPADKPMDPTQPTDDPDPGASDASTDRSDHEGHGHTHAPVIFDDGPLPGGLEGL